MNGYFENFRQSSPPSVAHDGIRASDINERIIRIYAEQSAIFLADRDAYQSHWAKHPSFCAAAKCADGRMYLPSITGTPTGLIKPFRAIGGRFEVFWSGFRDELNAFVDSADAKGSGAILFATYHFSASNPRLGCKGWKFDTSGARAHTIHLCRDLDEVYRSQLAAIPTGIETDRDIMILHGPQGKDVTGESLIGLSADRARSEIRTAFPNMEEQALTDLLPFLLGNARRVEELTRKPRSLGELGHGERVIAVGRGFSGLARANLALMQNDFDPNLDDAIVTQAEVIEENLRMANHGDDATLFACMTYSGARGSRSYREAVASAFGLCRFAQGHIKHRRPILWHSRRLHHLVGVVNEATKGLEVLEAV